MDLSPEDAMASVMLDIEDMKFTGYRGGGGGASASGAGGSGAGGSGAGTSASQAGGAGAGGLILIEEFGAV